MKRITASPRLVEIPSKSFYTIMIFNLEIRCGRISIYLHAQINTKTNPTELVLCARLLTQD